MCEYWEFPTIQDERDCRQDAECKCLMELEVDETEFVTIFNLVIIQSVGDLVWEQLIEKITSNSGKSRINPLFNNFI